MSFLPLSAPQSLNQPTLLPSPLPNPSTSDPTDDAYNQDPQTELPSSLHPPPNFQPIFTLLSTTSTSTTHHPNIYYVFTDDAPDTDPITAAALQVLQPAASATSSPTVGPQGGNAQARKERYVLLDMDATGTKVESAQSMSPDWAVTSTEVGPAPTWDRDGEGKEEGQEGRGLMLRIEGMEVGREEEGEGETGKEGEGKKLEELVEVYERQMAELRRVVDSGQGITSGGEGGR